MKKTKIYIYSIAVVAIILGVLFYSAISESSSFSERVKIAMREVGNQVLLSQQDSTSLILPVKEISKTEFSVTFENNLVFEPNKLVTIVDSMFTKVDLPKNYRVEVEQCEDKEVAYSYLMNLLEDKTIIACSGRYLPNACYIINVRFTNLYKSYYIIAFIILFLFILLIGYLEFRKKSEEKVFEPKDYKSIGRYKFYPEQNKLVKEAKVISLSKKECEILDVFVSKPNMIISRDELTKKVWEDNGVFVGRSLDTYISKLRKKLQEDTSIKLTNIHGVGYKLEIV